jgi:hypothetical protein
MAEYHGAVSVVDSAGYSFDAQDEAPAPASNVPIRLAVVEPGRGCATLSPLPAGEEQSSHFARTDAAGKYDLWIIVSGFIGAKNSLLLCIDDPRYQRFEYSAVYETTKEPRHGEKSLNIRLVQAQRSQ